MPMMLDQRAMTIDADPALLHDARTWACRAAADAGLERADRDLVRLALSEAVTNAIQHGSPQRGDRIELEVFEADGSLVFEVRDRGTFVAPLTSATLDAESGRGLELLALTMDEVHITSAAGGSTLRFAKRLH